MSGLTEAEILTRHSQSLKEAKDQCLWLSQNADPDKIAPRARRYRGLQQALKELEGTCRQLAQFRQDARWIKLGVLYAKAMRTVTKIYEHQNWLAFKELTQLFDNGIVRMEELATAKTGTVGPILPKNPSSWLILPEQRQKQQLWTPQGRMAN